MKKNNSKVTMSKAEYVVLGILSVVGAFVIGDAVGKAVVEQLDKS